MGSVIGGMSLTFSPRALKDEVALGILLFWLEFDFVVPDGNIITAAVT